MSIGEMNRRPTFRNESYLVDSGGGPRTVTIEQWDVWAEIKDRTGNTYAAQATDLVRYDYRVRVRYDNRFSSSTVMVYNDQECKCESMSIETEGKKRFLILRYSKIETFSAAP